MATSSNTATDAPAASKRASSRVRKQPQHYTSSPFSSNSKRKRGDDEPADANEDVDMDDEEESEEEEDPEDNAPAEEEIRAQKRARKPKSSAPKKPAQKKPKVNGVTLPIRPVTKGAGKRAPAKKRAPKKAMAVNTADAEAAGGLYAELFAHGKAFEEVVDQWLQAFEAHESRALADIINFMLKAAGCDGKVTEDDIEDPDNATPRLSDLQEEHKATQPTDYPLIAKGKNAGAAFKATISTFMQVLIKSMAAKGLLSEPELMENMQIWLPVMASATDRPFRHTATVCSLSINTALCEIASELATKSADNQRHADAESKRPKPNKERVKQIEQKAKEASHQLERVRGYIKDWFETVFIHRYRDVDPLIRRDCVEALGDWILSLPDEFFDGHHLRYLGWQLSDENAAVRLEDVKQLRRLYDDSDKIGGLRTFTERFRSRMVEIGTSDADTGVRVAGLELLDVLRANDLLEPDDIDAIGRLVFHEDNKVRVAVAGFFSANVNDLYNARVDELGGFESLEEAIPDPGEGNFEAPRVEWLRFKSLAESLQAYDQDDTLPSHVERSKNDGSLVLHAAGVDSRFTLAVDVLYDKIDDLHDWEALAGHLLFDHSGARANGAGDDSLSQLKAQSTLEPDEEITLLEVLNACVKRSLGALAEKITGTKSKLTKKQKEELQEEQEEAVRNLTEIIPKLLRKFGDESRTAGAVLRLEGVLALPALQGLRYESAASASLLEDLRKQFMSHGTDEVLAPATAAILHAQSYGELDDTATDKITTLWEDVVGNLAELLNVKTVTVRGAAQQQELTALSNNLLRICRLAQVSNCIAPLEDTNVAAKDDPTGKEYNGAIDFIIDLVQRATHSSGPSPDPEEAQLEDLVAARAAEAALFYFRWKLLSIMTAIKTGASSELGDEMLEALAERRDAYAENLEKALDSRRASEPICSSVSGCLLDLYTSSAVLRTVKGRPGLSDSYTVLIMDFDEDRQKSVMKVFAAVEREFAKLTGKRLEEAVSEDAVEEDVDADPIDDDPLSDDGSDDETQPPTQATQQQRNAKAMKPVLAEERLCQLTAKIVYAMASGVFDDRSHRKRLERNKSKLGHNFKEVLNYLDAQQQQKKQVKGKGKAKPPKATTAPPAAKKTTTTTTKASAKSNAIVADSDHEDEIEDAEEEEEEEEEARRQRELLEAGEGRASDEDEEDEAMAANGAPSEQEAAESSGARHG
ncbi:Cohesin subunit psc3 [Lecanosticta acicola]|uniref:Cohesin subunit psc3 n=1 Tax=Lecanosticta acicola TaxID=111012 RepID=A0AAI9EBE1_9PEZI|nr:Cohesin subunit psc3 [Lecanosticta acicola]